MKKETVAAVFFGVLLGVVGAFVLIGKARLIGSQPDKGIPNTKNVTPAVLTIAPSQLLEIIEPKPLSIYETNKVVIKGKAGKDSLIVIQSPIKEEVLTIEKDTFSKEFPLALGENVISISLYSKNPKVSPQQKTLKIYYLDEK